MQVKINSTINNLMEGKHTSTSSELKFVKKTSMESKLTVLPEVAGDVLGLPGRLAEPLPHLPEHVLHRVHRIWEKKTHHTKAPRKLRNGPNSGRIGG